MNSDSALFLYSVLLGFGMGLCYEALRFLRLAFPHPLLFTAAEDFFACVAGTVVFLFFTFAFSDGIVRWFSLFGAGIGLFFYHNTLGRFLNAISERVLKLLRRLLFFLYRITLSPLQIVFKKITNWLLSRIKSLGIIIAKRARAIRLQRMKRKVLSLAEKGFLPSSKRSFSCVEQDFSQSLR